MPGVPQVSPGDHGGAMTAGVDYIGDLHVGDVDQWTFTAGSGSAISLTMEEIGGDSLMYPWMRVYRPDGTLQSSTYAALTATLNFTASQPGTYTIVASTADSGNDVPGDYRLRGTGFSTPVDLRLIKTQSTGHVEPGATITYTLTGTNLSVAATTGVVITDTLPAGLTVTSCTATGVACAGTGSTRTATFAAVAGGGSVTMTIVATVSASAGSSLINTASISNGLGDLNAVDNASSVTTVVADDGLPNTWETQFGLDPNSSEGGSGAEDDPDNDGRTNAQEYTDGTHPRGFFRRYLAEGANNAFFDVRLALLNVGSQDARLLRRFLQPGGAVVTQFEVLPPGRRRTLTDNDLGNLTSPDFSTVVESDQPIVFDRTMTWGGGYGSHAESGVPNPSTTWYLAEGSTSGVFALFYLIQNPNATPTVATVKYLLPLGQAPITRQYALPANSRTTIPVDEQGGVLANTDVSAEITAALPIIVERAMYRSSPTQAFAAGHGSAGVTAAARTWFLAEGGTGPFFDCFILLANPQTVPATATINYLLSDGRTFTKAYTVPAQGRFTIWVDAEEIPAGSGARPLDNVAVSSTVTSDQDIIVERTMWWPSPATSADYWTEAHNSPGATSTGTYWAMAEGEVGGPDASETYILIANTSTFAGSARVTLYFEDGSSVQKDVPLLPRSRRNVAVSSEFPQAANRRFGSTVESLGTTPAEIVVERAMYTSPGGAVWTAGTNALAAKVTR
jgi:uncharacterized repeat protein (TIGR01451 family)